MSKRRRESTSSSSSGESDNAEGYGGAKVSDQPPLVSEQKETSPVASTLTQLHGVIVKEEPEEDEVHEIIVKEELDLVESEVEDSDLTASPQLRIDRFYSCSATSTGQQSNPEERRKHRVSSKVQIIPKDPPQPPPSKKVPAINRHQKYSESSTSDECDSMSTSGAPPLANGNGTRKRARSSSAEQMETSTLPSTSTQLHWELGVIVKQEPEECSELGITVKEELEAREVANQEPDELTVYPRLRIDRSYSCPSSSTSQQSTPEVRRSNRVSSNVQKISVGFQQPRPSKKIPAPKPHEKFLEGSVVMGWLDLPGNPYYPGMIRAATPAEDKEHPGYTRNHCGKAWFFVQFFSNPTTLHWRAAGNLRLFDAAKQYKFSYRHPDDVAEFQKGIRIAKEALSFSVEARLAKFTLPQDATIDALVDEVENDQQTPREDDDTPPTGGLLSSHANHNVSVAQDEDGPAQSNRRSITDVVAGLKRQAEFLKTTNLEKDGAIKALTEDNSKLTGELKKVKNTNRDLTQHLRSKDELIAQLRVKLARTDKQKLEYLEELEKMRSEVESLEAR